ncbi:MAG: HAMP domain-containing histidine kinase [Oscillospiraceae bacterium]|nr:HAMP domain-containing histidine kinase [Oscillospiraceae bacterium]
MKKQFDSIFGHLSQAVLIAADGEICYCNAPGEKLFPDCIGKRAGSLLPEAVLNFEAENFSGSVFINDRDVSLTAGQLDKYRVFTFHTQPEDEPAPNTTLADLTAAYLHDSLNVAIMASASLSALLEKEDDPKLETYLSIQNHSLYSMLRMVNNLAYLKNINDGGKKMDKSVFDLDQLCGELCNSVDLLVRGRLAAIEYKCVGRDFNVFADRRKISKAILNLLSNSLKYTDKSGKIKVLLSMKGKNAIISVTDNGCGISPEKQSDVFHSYRRPRELSDAKAGLGLGMSIVNHIARLHGGSVMLESRKNGGTHVTMMFPAGLDNVKLLRSPVTELLDNSSNDILTELSDVLDRSCYIPAFME